MPKRRSPLFKRSRAAGTRFCWNPPRRAGREGATRLSARIRAPSLKATAARIRITEGGAVREFETERDPLHELEALMARYRAGAAARPRRSAALSAAARWAILRTTWCATSSRSARAPKDELGLPGVALHDHRDGAHFRSPHPRAAHRAQCAHRRARRRRRLCAGRRPRSRRWSSASRQPSALPPIPARQETAPIVPRCNTTRAEYEQMVRDAHEYIHAGDIFQIVPSQRFETDYTGDPLTLYRTLRFVNPSPYMFCLKFGGRFALVGSSPEVHVRAVDGKVEIRPIAGTMRRGADRGRRRAQRADPARRSQGARRAPDARRPRPQRRRPRRRVRHRQSHRLHDHREVLARHAHRLERRGRAAPGPQRLRRHARHLPRRHRQRLAQSARHADHQSIREEQTRMSMPARSATSASMATATPASPCARSC